MLRVTIELVPFGSEELAKTISEICIANVQTIDGIATYEASGYQIRDGKISEFAVELEEHNRKDGALKLVAEVLLAPKKLFSEVELAEKLLSRTRLMTGEKEEQ